MIARIPWLIGILLFALGCRDEKLENRIWDGSTQWPALNREQWRDLILGFYAYGAPFNPESVVLGEPVSEEELDALEREFGLPLPSEFRHFYGTQNGFGMKQTDGTIDWVFVPISNIPTLTAKTRDWMRRVYPEIENRVITFVDWDEDETGGILYSESGEPSEKVYVFVPGNIGNSGKPYYTLEGTIAGVLTEPYTPPRLQNNTEGEQADGGSRDNGNG